jgi:hypothetical protein
LTLPQAVVGRRQVLYVCYFDVRTLPGMFGQVWMILVAVTGVEQYE